MVLLVFGVDGFELARGGGGREERGVEEGGEAVQRPKEPRGGDEEEVVGVGCAGEGVEGAAVFC